VCFWSASWGCLYRQMASRGSENSIRMRPGIFLVNRVALADATTTRSFMSELDTCQGVFWPRALPLPPVPVPFPEIRGASGAEGSRFRFCVPPAPSTSPLPGPSPLPVPSPVPPRGVAERHPPAPPGGQPPRRRGITALPTASASTSPAPFDARILLLPIPLTGIVESGILARSEDPKISMDAAPGEVRRSEDFNGCSR
jgi:hypothetical protein